MPKQCGELNSLTKVTEERLSKVQMTLQELGLRRMRVRSARVLCHKSVPLGPSLQMCTPVWAPLTNLAPLLKPAELEWRGHCVLWSSNLQEKRGSNQAWGDITRDITLHIALETAWGRNGGQSQPLAESQWMGISLLSKNLRVWTISDPWPLAPRAVVTSDWAKHLLKRQCLVAMLNHSKDWFLGPDCGTVGLNIHLLQERWTDVLLCLHLLGCFQLPPAPAPRHFSVGMIKWV